MWGKLFSRKTTPPVAVSPHPSGKRLTDEVILLFSTSLCKSKLIFQTKMQKGIVKAFLFWYNIILERYRERSDLLEEKFKCQKTVA